MLHLVISLILLSIASCCPNKGNVTAIKMYQLSKHEELYAPIYTKREDIIRHGGWEKKNEISYQDLENEVSYQDEYRYKFINIYIYNNFLDNCFGIREGAYNQNVLLYFQFSHHTIDDPNIKIKNGDLYLIHNGQKIFPSKVHFGWKDFTGEDLTGEHFIFTKKAFLVDQTGGSKKIITFPIKLQNLLDDNTKLVIEKMYYKDKVVVQNIEFGFKNGLYKDCCIPYDGSPHVNIKLLY